MPVMKVRGRFEPPKSGDYQDSEKGKSNRQPRLTAQARNQVKVPIFRPWSAVERSVNFLGQLIDWHSSLSLIWALWSRTAGMVG